MALEFVYEEGEIYPLMKHNCEKYLLQMTEVILSDFSKIMEKEMTGYVHLPFDATGEDFYFFDKVSSPVSVELHLTINSELDYPQGDGEYYSEDSTVGIKLEIPEFYDYFDVTYCLTELLAHELTHFLQDDSGYEFPKKKVDKIVDYYLQPHELEAQWLGFAVTGMKFGISPRLVMKIWIDNSPMMKNLTFSELELLQCHLKSGCPAIKPSLEDALQF